MTLVALCSSFGKMCIYTYICNIYLLYTVTFFIFLTVLFALLLYVLLFCLVAYSGYVFFFNIYMG